MTSSWDFADEGFWNILGYPSGIEFWMSSAAGVLNLIWLVQQSRIHTSKLYKLDKVYSVTAERNGDQSEVGKLCFLKAGS